MSQDYVKIADGYHFKRYASIITENPASDAAGIVVRTIPSGVQEVSFSSSLPSFVQLTDGYNSPVITNTTPGSNDYALVVRTIGGGGSSGLADKSSFTYGLTEQVTIGGVYQDTSPTLTAGQAGAARLTQYRALHINIRDTLGNEKISQATMVNSIPVVIASDQTAITVSGSGTFTVSGTVTSNIGTTGGLALDTTLSKLTIAQGTALGLNTQALIGGSVTTASPSYTTGQISPLSLTTAGALRIDGSGTTQPVSGTVKAQLQDNDGYALSSTGNSLNVNITGGSSSGAVADKTIFIYGTTSNTTIGGVFQEISPTLTTGQSGAVRLTSFRALHINLRDSDGYEKIDQQIMTRSIPVVIASDQTNIPVTGIVAATQSGTWTIQPLTNSSIVKAQLQDNGGNAISSLDGYLNVNIASGSSSGAIADKTSFIYGSTNDTIIGGVFQDTSPTLSDGQSGAVRLTQYRAFHTNLRDSDGYEKLNQQTMTRSIPVVIASDQSIIPISGTIVANAGSGTFTVSGTVTSNIGTTNGLALDATVSALQISQGSSTSGQKGELVQAAVTTVAPSYTNAQTSPLSLTIAGALRTDSSSTTQPISGTVAATQSGSWTIQPLTNSSVVKSQLQDNSGNGISSLDGYLNVNIASGSTSGAVVDKTSFIYGASNDTIIGGVFQDTSPTLTSGQSGAVRLTENRGFHVNLRDADGYEKVDQQVMSTSIPVVIASDQSAINIIGTVTSNIGTTGGLALDATVSALQVSQGSTTSGQRGELIQGAVTSSAPSYTNAQTSPLSLTTAGALRTDSSSVVQPVSGTVAVTQSGSWTIEPLTNSSVIKAQLQDNNGNGISSLDGYLNVNIAGGSSSGAVADKTLFIYGSTNDTIIGGVFQDAGTVLTSGQSGAARLTENRGIHVNLRNSDGYEKLDQQLMSTSIPVVIASDQTPISIVGTVAATQSGTWTIQPLNNSSIVKAQLQDNSGNGISSLDGYLNVNIASGSSSGAVQDKSAFIYGSTNDTIIGGVFQDAYTTLIDGESGAVRLTENRAFHVNLRDNDGYDKIGQQSMSGSIPVVIASDQSAISISGTITSNIGTTGGLALDATVSALQVAQTSTTSGQSGTLIQGAVTTSSPSYTNAKTSPLSLTTAGALRIDGSGVTQPISGTVSAIVGGTVTANIGTTGGLALDATLDKLNVIQDTLTSDHTGPLIQGAVTSATPSYTDFNTNPLSLTTSGELRVTGGGVAQGSTTSGQSGILIQGAVTNSFPVSYADGQTSPLSLTNIGLLRVDTSNTSIIANIGTSGDLALDSSVNGLLLAQNTTLNEDAFGPLIQGAVTSATPSYADFHLAALSLTTSGELRVTGGGVTQGSTTSGQSGTLIQGAVTTSTPSYTNAQTSPLSLTTAGRLRIDGSGTTQPVSGTVTANAGSGTFTVSGTVTSNIGTTGGLALDATVSALQVSQGSSTGGQNGSLIQGAVTTAAPSYTNNQTSPLSLTTAGRLRIDGSGTTQPVSGTVTANIGTSGSLALDSSVNGILVSPGAANIGQPGPVIKAYVSTIAQSYSDDTINNLSLTTAGRLRIDGSGTTQPVSGTVTATGTITANIGTTNGLALDSSVNGILVSPGAANIGQPGPVLKGVVTTIAQSYSDSTINHLSLTTAGALRIDGSGTTQPISGTVISNIGTTNGLALDATLTKLTLVQNTPTSGQQGPLIQGAVTASAPSYTDFLTSPLSLTTAGALRVDNSGLALDATLAKLTIAQSTALGSNTQALIGGSVSTSVPSYTDGNINPFSLTTDGGLRVTPGDSNGSQTFTVSSNKIMADVIDERANDSINKYTIRTKEN